MSRTDSVSVPGSGVIGASRAPLFLAAGARFVKQNVPQRKTS